MTSTTLDDSRQIDDRAMRTRITRAALRAGRAMTAPDLAPTDRLRTLQECHGIIMAMRGPANGLSFTRFRELLHDDIAAFVPPGTDPQGLVGVSTFDDGTVSGDIFDLDFEQRAVLRTVRRLGNIVGGMDDDSLRDEIDQETIYETLKRTGDDKTYAEGRRALIENPVRPADDVVDLPLSPVVRAAYLPIHADTKIDGWWFPCPICAWPMQIRLGPSRGRRRGAETGTVRCWHRPHAEMGASYEFRVPDDSSTPSLEAATTPPHVPARRAVLAPQIGRPPRALRAEEYLSLSRGIWRYTTVPGLVEISLCDVLRRLGFNVLLWPGLDAYDLEVSIKNADKAWRVDVKDYTSGAALAGLIEAQHGDSGGAEWLVIPDHRADQIPLLTGVCARHNMNVDTATGFGIKVCKEAGVSWA